MQGLQGKHEQPFSALTCALVCDCSLVSSLHSLYTLLLFVDACSESGSKEQLRSYTKAQLQTSQPEIYIKAMTCNILVSRPLFGTTAMRAGGYYY